MPIYIYPDRIEFPNYSLRINSSGVGVTTPTGTKISGTFTTVGSILTIANQGLTRGYASGGGNTSFSTTLNVIDQYPFATNANATDVGDLTQIRQGAAGASSSVSGYSSGGFTPPPTVSNVIDKFPFAANANATDVGDLTQVRARPAGQSSSVSGYSSGLGTVGIDKFPFATRSNAASIGSISQARSVVTGTSSTTNGYTQGGYNFPNLSYNTIDRFPFATDASSSDVGDLTVARWGTAGQQY